MSTRFYGASAFNIGTFFCREGRKERRAKHEQWVTMGLGNVTQTKKEKKVSKAQFRGGTARCNSSDATTPCLAELLLKLQFSCWI